MSKKNKIFKHIQKIKREYQRERTDLHSRKNTRVAIPFNMQCINCSEQIPKGRKFYSTHSISNKTYLGVEIHVFEITCPSCKKTITFKTDPKNGEYLEDLNCKKVTIKENKFEIGKTDLEIKEMANVIRNVDYEKLKELIKKNDGKIRKHD